MRRLVEGEASTREQMRARAGRVADGSRRASFDGTRFVRKQIDSLWKMKKRKKMFYDMFLEDMFYPGLRSTLKLFSVEPTFSVIY